MQDGRIMKIDTPKAITESYAHPLYAIRTDQMYQLPRDLLQLRQCFSADRFGESVHAKLHENSDPSTVRSFLEAKGHDAIVIDAIPATIEDVFLEFIRK
jgi:hypothetical protein